MTDQNESSPQANAERPGQLPTWKKALLILALIVGCLGLGLKAVAHFSGPDQRAGIQSQGKNLDAPTMQSQEEGQSGFDPNRSNLRSTDPSSSPEIPKTEQGTNLWDWSTFMTKTGFSFFVGFCIGYALLVFTKTAIFGLGVIALILFGLQYAGFVSIDWLQIQAFFASFVDWLQPHANHFKEFITGHLPSSGSAAAGLWVGFKKR